ncbi:Bug family tripartite tricarboxylate transporter substrate binding protein [Zwartia panacis]|uniref:Bug family tripartite tricarboxylate transporter substrate binding protein n=1 Tax=Zwartia panacis TaxID=2683345 RepID=UPI0025B4C087|nr:tripartite tricarboxylate transporter substrate binding protein [Zwartia panacis]MDN4017678.1 tripartite tricarboxylate transporter substrate binding protein [Zwartia panacis]
MKLRQLLSCLLSLACLLSASASAQGNQAYPDKPIRLIVGYAPGGATDIVARMLAQELTPIMGQSVIVENRAGGGTLVGTDSIKRANPDGYNLLFGTNAFVITPLLHAGPTYDPVKDFSPVSLTTIQPLGLLVTPGLKIKTVEQLIDYARKNPGKLNFASSGNGSAQHLAGESFRVAAGIDLVHVPYKGAGPALVDLLAGRVDMMFTSLVGNTEHIKEGRLELIATSGSKRGAATPDVPTVGQTLPGFTAYTWQGVIAPANTPPAVIDRLNSAIKKVAANPKFYEKLAAQGMEVQTSTPAEFRARLETDHTQYKELLQRTQTSIR